MPRAVTTEQTLSVEAPGEPAGLDPEILAPRRLLKGRAITLYQAGRPMLDICDALGIGEDTLMMWRREEGLVKPRAPKGYSRLATHTADLKRAWFGEETLDVIARRYGTSASRLSTFAKSRGWPQRKPRPALARLPVRRTHLHIDEIKALWDQGVTAVEIGRKIGVSGTAIREVVRRQSWPARLTPRIEKEELVLQGLLAGLSARGIALLFGLRWNTVKRIVRDLREAYKLP